MFAVRPRAVRWTEAVCSWFQRPVPIRSSNEDDFALNRIMEDVFCEDVSRSGIAVCLRVIPIIWACILFGHVFQLIQPTMLDEYHRTTYILAVSLDLWFRFTYCTLWVVNEERTTRAKACCLSSFLCCTLEFLSIAAMVTYYFDLKNDTLTYLWVAKISTFAQCLLQSITLYLTRSILDVAHITGALVAAFFIIVPASFLNISPSVLYISIIVLPAATSFLAFAATILKQATRNVYNMIAFLTIVASFILKYTHILGLFVFANNRRSHLDDFVYSLGTEHASLFHYYRERVLIAALILIAMALGHLWRSGDFSHESQDIGTTCRLEAQLGSPKLCNKKYTVSNSNARLMSDDIPAVEIAGSCEKVDECIICFDRIRSVVLEPCEHIVGCLECSIRLVEKMRNPTCPLCRTTVSCLLLCAHDAADEPNIVTARQSRLVTMCHRPLVRSRAESESVGMSPSSLQSAIVSPSNPPANSMETDIAPPHAVSSPSTSSLENLAHNSEDRYPSTIGRIGPGWEPPLRPSDRSVSNDADEVATRDPHPPANMGIDDIV